MVQWKVFIFHCSQTSSCMFSASLYLLEQKKILSPQWNISTIPNSKISLWAPLKFLLLPIRYRFLSFQKKNQAPQGQDFPDPVPGHRLQLSLCSYRAMQWVVLTLTHWPQWLLGHSVCFSWEPPHLGACEGRGFWGIRNVQHIQTFADHSGQLTQLSQSKTCMCKICLIIPGLCFRLRCFWFPRVSSWTQHNFFPRDASCLDVHEMAALWAGGHWQEKNKEPCIICL